MSLVDKFERRLEKLVEGAFSKAFRSGIEPSEIAKRLLREMEAGKSISVTAVYVPNSYVIGLAPDDHARFEGLMASLQKEFIDLLRAQARQRRWRPAGPLDVQFEQADGVKPGSFKIKAAHQSSGDDLRPAAALSLVGSRTGQSWELAGDEATLGRASSSTIVVDDPNASRSHARVSFRDGQWWIEDLRSTNGTLVNEALVKQRPLTPGDRIRIGATELEYRED